MGVDCRGSSGFADGMKAGAAWRGGGLGVLGVAYFLEYIRIGVCLQFLHDSHFDAFTVSF